MNNSANQEILFIEPVFKQMIWGGCRLAAEWGYDVPGSNTGECWAVSAHPEGDCVVKKGAYAGKTLSRLWTEAPELFGSLDGDRFPLMVKIIDAKDDLSIQVHPGAAYAAENENDPMGKAECWYILDAPENASLIVGHNAKNKEELADMIRNGRWEAFLREIPVKKGDFIQIDPGTIHAIRRGIEILETEQNSALTYRVYDYGRLVNGRPRELHLDKGLDVITVPDKPIEASLFHAGGAAKDQMFPLISCQYYHVWRLDIKKGIRFDQEHPFLIMSVFEGSGLINGQPVKKGDHFILPDRFGEVQIQGRLQMIASTVPNGFHGF